MIVEIDKSIFNADDSVCTLKELQRLLAVIFIETERYKLKISDSSIFDSKYFQMLSIEDQDLIKLCFDASITESLETDRLIIKGGQQFYSEPKYNVQEGFVFLTAPICVWLENNYNDSFFVLALFRCLRKEIAIDEWQKKSWITFENLGGCANAVNALAGKLKEKDGKSKMFKYFILLDSDKKWSGDKISKYNNLIDFCNKNGILYHILQKRTMENYMPDEVFDEFRDKMTNSWINSYLYLSPEQKDYFNISKGFNGNIYDEAKRDLGCNGRKYVDVEVQQLYSSVSDENYKNLEQGLKISDFKTKFPEKYSTSPYVYASTLLNRTSHQTDPKELNHIIDKILELA
ncbi:MAG: hypothetical protein IKP45_10070 [Bacteroidales bacterium]|nr:hypothetical protein [Bacteroidales bacterium]